MADNEVTICNQALSRLGISDYLTVVGSGTLAECTDTNIEYRTCLLWYATKRDELFEAFPWPFCRDHVSLGTPVTGVIGTDLWASEWVYSYAYPAGDGLRVRRFLTGTYEGEPNPYRYVIRQVGGTRRILTNVPEAEAIVEYTLPLDDVGEFHPAFTSALVWSLAKELKGPLASMMDAATAQRVEFEYQRAMATAASLEDGEETRWPSEGGRFIRARRGGIWARGGSRSGYYGPY